MGFIIRFLRFFRFFFLFFVLLVAEQFLVTILVFLLGLDLGLVVYLYLLDRLQFLLGGFCDLFERRLKRLGAGYRCYRSGDKYRKYYGYLTYPYYIFLTNMFGF